MERGEARTQLRDGNARERLAAARAFRDIGRPEDKAFLILASQQESDEYVRAALLEAVATIGEQGGPRERAVLVTGRSEIVRVLTGRITHEFASIVGTLRYYAEREVPNYDDSETRRELDRLDAVLDAVRQLSSAADESARRPIGLREFVEGLVRDVRVDFPDTQVLLEGPTVTVEGDEGLLASAVVNALKNAIEATEGAGSEDPVVVAWGTDNRVAWVTVLDRGPGPAAGVDELSEIGASTKEDHPGMGLAIAREAALSLGGDVSLDRRDAPGGARFRLEWPIAGALE